MARVSWESLAQGWLCSGCMWKHARVVSVFIQADSPRNFGRSEISGDLIPEDFMQAC